MSNSARNPSTMIDVLKEVRDAERRIRAHVRTTPLEHSAWLSDRTGCEVHLKLENVQHTGSFKARGAVSKLLALAPEARAEGVVAASTGNHGAAVAFAADALGTGATVFVPEGASASKVKRMRLLGAEVRTHGTDSGETETFARAFAKRRGRAYVSPYNDPQVIGGQGTIAVELMRQIGRIDAVFASVGGGGMISGIAGYLKRKRREAEVIGCSPSNSCVMFESVRAGHVVSLESRPTLSDGTAGGIEEDAVTLELCRRWVDDWVLVSEEEIRRALVGFLENHSMLIEGSAAVAVAAFLGTCERFRGRNVVIVLCGGNISLETLRGLLVD